MKDTPQAPLAGFPPLTQLMAFFVICILSANLFYLLEEQILNKFFGIGGLEQLDTYEVGAQRIVYYMTAFTFQLGFFLVPALLFLQLTGFKRGFFLGTDLKPRLKPLLIAAVFVIPGYVLAQHLHDWNQLIPMEGDIKTLADEAADQRSSFFDIMFANVSLGQLLLGFLSFAVLPAVAEEIAFRGILFRFIEVMSMRKTIPLVLSSFIFALFHADLYVFIPTFFFGLILAYIYQLTRNLWYSIALHLAYNSLTIGMVCLEQRGYISEGTIELLQNKITLLIAVLASTGLLLLFRSISKRTIQSP